MERKQTLLTILSSVLFAACERAPEAAPPPPPAQQEAAKQEATKVEVSPAVEIPLFLKQETHDSYFPVKFVPAPHDPQKAADSQRIPDFQKAAQTFLPLEEHGFLTEVSPYIAYTLGSQASLELFEVEDLKISPGLGKTLRTIKLDMFDFPRGDFQPIPIEPPLPLEKGKVYGFSIQVKENGHEVGVGNKSYKNVFPNGRAWYFTRKIGGNGKVLDERYGWQTYNDDLAFRLRFLNRPAEKD